MRCGSSDHTRARLRDDCNAPQANAWSAMALPSASLDKQFRVVATRPSPCNRAWHPTRRDVMNLDSIAMNEVNISELADVEGGIVPLLVIGAYIILGGLA